MKKEKNTYITPILTVVEFKTERGYAYSFGGNVDEVGNHIQDQLMFFVNESQISTGDATLENGFVGGYMTGAAEDNSSAVGDWTYQNGSHF